MKNIQGPEPMADVSDFYKGYLDLSEEEIFNIVK